MSSLQQKQSQMSRKVREGINFILRHFPEDKIFPRAISTKDSSGEEFIVYNKKEMFRAYEQSDFIDCKVSCYATEENIDDSGLNRQTPDFILIDMNSSILSFGAVPHFDSRLVDQVEALYAILQNIKELLHGANPTILWAGNCFHIYQPVQAITLEEIEEFIDSTYIAEFRRFLTQEYILSNLFLDFSKQRLILYKTNDYYYWNNNGISFHHMLIIPGTLKSKCPLCNEEEEVQVVQTWDGNTPKLELLLADFQTYLADRKREKVNARMPYYYYNHS